MKKTLFVLLAGGIALSASMRADTTVTTSTLIASASDASGTASATDTSTAAVVANDAPGSLKAGNRLLSAGKFDEAVAYFQGIGVQSADNGTAKREPYRQLGLATAYLGLGKYQQSEDAASQAIALDKDLEAAWQDLGVAQGTDGQRDKAIDTYTKGIAQLTADKVDAGRLQSNLDFLNAAKQKSSGDSDATTTPTTDASAPVSGTSATSTSSTTSGQ